MRRHLVIFIGLLVSAAYPNAIAYGQQRTSQASPPRSSPAQPAEYQQPCGQDQENRNSDLCAQWHAADWAKRSFWVALVGAIGLVITLWFNLQAWRIARKGQDDTRSALKAAQEGAAAASKLAETAESTARAELRAYLDFDGVRVARWPEMDVAGSGKVCVLVTTKINNYGKTPAENLAVNSATFVEVGEKRVPLTAGDTVDFDTVAPNDHFRNRAYFHMLQAHWDALEKGQISVIVSVVTTYADVFKKPHLLRSDFKTISVKEDLGFLKGTRKAT